jgi:hypothetical protein
LGLSWIAPHRSYFAAVVLDAVPCRLGSCPWRDAIVGPLQYLSPSSSPVLLSAASGLEYVRFTGCRSDSQDDEIDSLLSRSWCYQWR